MTAPTSRSLRPGENVRVALIGALGHHKGYGVLLDCARDANKRQLPLEFVVIGHTDDDARLEGTGRVSVTGRYAEGEAPTLLRRERPHVAFMASVWPETWCFALDPIVAAGLPVVAFDIGAIPERLRAAGSGVLLPLESNARTINDALMRVASGEIRRDAARSAGEPTKVQRVMVNSPKAKQTDEAAGTGLSASVQVLPLPLGLYFFSVSAAAPGSRASFGNLMLPAIHIGSGPGVPEDHVEFVAGPATNGTWLFAPGDMVVVRVTGAEATLVLTSIRSPGGEALSIKIERLDSRVDEAKIPDTTPRAAPAATTSTRRLSSDGLGLPLQISAHIRARGDRKFTDAAWAGRIGPGLWIESFSVKPLDGIGADEIEYKALTSSGFETPWMSDDQMCGTQGMAVPLVGFAVRLKAGPRTTAYECEYSGYFGSGITAGPCRNGAPCRSTVANDPLEGFQIRITKSGAAGRTPAVVIPSPRTSRETGGVLRPLETPPLIKKGAAASSAAEPGATRPNVHRSSAGVHRSSAGAKRRPKAPRQRAARSSRKPR